MSIATEIQRLQEAKADIKAAIEEKGVEVGNGLIDGYADKVDAVYDKGVTDGKKSQYDEFWDAFQQNGNRTNYRYAFYNIMWNDITYNPKYPIVCSANSSQMFDYSGITDTKVDITVTMAGVGQLFKTQNLITIKKLIVTENVTFNQWFQNASSLQNITIEGVIGNDIDLQYSTMLTKESIASIVNALSDTQGATLTLSKEAVNREFGSDTSDEWIKTIADKVSSYNGVTYDGLWTISLV